MDQVIIKSTKRGMTVYVPKSQCAAFIWIMSEGEAGLDEAVLDDRHVTEGQENWNGFVHKG